MDKLTPGQRRTAAATAARKRARRERMAAELRAAGYLVIGPEEAQNERGRPYRITGSSR